MQKAHAILFIDVKTKGFLRGQIASSYPVTGTADEAQLLLAELAMPTYDEAARLLAEHLRGAPYYAWARMYFADALFLQAKIEGMKKP